MTTAGHIRTRLGAIAGAAQTGADALGGARLDRCEGTLEQLLVELDALAGRLELVVDRLVGAAVNPARARPNPAGLEALAGHRDGRALGGGG
jgi:hypothetical protein